MGRAAQSNLLAATFSGLSNEPLRRSASETPASKIVLGLNCGGSDSFSGITANPALGHCSDLIVEQGGTVVLAETTEIFGAEHLLTRRARSPEIAAEAAAYYRKLQAVSAAIRWEFQR